MKNGRVSHAACGMRRGQVTTEYFIIAAVLAVMSLIVMSAFHGLIREQARTLVNAAAEAFAH